MNRFQSYLHKSPTSKSTSYQLLLISSLSLFLELMVIRWLSCEIRIFAYFKNLPLMAAFLGFGIGFSLHTESDRWFKWFPRLISYLVIMIAAARGFGLTHVIFLDPRQYFLLGLGFGDHALQSIPPLVETLKAIVVIVFFFLLLMVTFATLASRIGALLNREKPLRGYTINVLGSLFGIIGFSLVSYLAWPPIAWLLLVSIPILYFYKDSLRYTFIYLGAAIGFTAFAALLNPAIWSPYYRISVTAHSPGNPHQTNLSVNYDGFQVIQNLSEPYLRQFPEALQRVLSRHYNIPYKLSKRKIESVLILGGGAGNDAAAALRNKAQWIDVVEIDPVIAQLGRDIHPEKPYSSNKVHLIIDDARSFLQRARRNYDLVIFATLDSHTVFSSLSSLRLDNFVFTRESLRNVRNRLKPGGGIAVNFFKSKPWLSQRHFDSLREVWLEPPLVYSSAANQEVLLLAGDLFDSKRDLGMTDYQINSPLSELSQVEPVTDDWPFLFLEKRGIPFHYMLPLIVILTLSFIPLKMAQVKIKEVDWHLFFMGAAFLLVETKAVTTLALVFGSTWMVNAFVIGSIMVMILLANCLVVWLPRLRFLNLYAGLTISLIVNLFFGFDKLNQLNWSLRLFISSFIIALPLFFAALIFAGAFESVASPSLALASNLLGSLLGGLLEYLDMWVGLRQLNLIAIILYLLSMGFLLLRMNRITRIGDPVQAYL